MGQFRHFLSEALLKEIHLQGRLFTWSNECSHPMLERIDRAFISSEWELMFPGTTCTPWLPYAPIMLLSSCKRMLPLSERSASSSSLSGQNALGF
jgi:hypothetical protein